MNNSVLRWIEKHENKLFKTEKNVKKTWNKWVLYVSSEQTN